MFFEIPKILRNQTKWLEKRQTSILSAATVITLANILSSISGLFRERLLIASYFGNEQSQRAYEAFNVAFQIPDLLFQLIVLGALSAAFIPIFTRYRKKSNKNAFRLTNVIMSFLMLVFFVSAILVFIFIRPLTVLRTGDAFTTAQIDIVVNLTRIMLVAQFFFIISNFFTGILQSFQRFIIPSIAPILYNIGIVLGVYFLSSRLGIYAAGVGVVFGAMIHMLIQMPLVYKLGFKFNFEINFSLKGVRELFKIAPPRMLAISVTEVQNLSLTFFATSIGNLSFVIITLGLKLMSLPIRLFGVPISQASLPFLSEESEANDLVRFRSLVIQSLNQISFFVLPASILLLILRLPIVRLVFGTQNFPWVTTVQTGKVVAIISLSIIAQAMSQLLIRTFYALKDTRTPFFVTLTTVSFYLFLSWIIVFCTSLGVLGLALVTLITAFIEAILLLILLEIQITTKFFDSSFYIPQMKMLASSFLMAVFLYLPFRSLDMIIFDTSKTVDLIALTIITSTIGMLVYIYFSALFRVKELSYITKLIYKFDSWRKSIAKTQEVFIETPLDNDEV